MTVKTTKKQNPGKKALTFVFCILLICVSVFFLTQVTDEVKTSFSLMGNLKEAEKELAQLEKEKENLINETHKLSDANYVSSVARGKYLITKSNEQIYVLPSLND